MITQVLKIYLTVYFITKQDIYLTKACQRQLPNSILKFIFLQESLYVNKYVALNVYMQVCMRVCTYMRVCICICLCIYIYVCVCTCVCICLYIYRYLIFLSLLSDLIQEIIICSCIFFNDKAIVIMLSIIRIKLQKTSNILFTIMHSVYYCTHVLYWTIMYLLYNTM